MPASPLPRPHTGTSHGAPRDAQVDARIVPTSPPARQARRFELFKLPLKSLCKLTLFVEIGWGEGGGLQKKTVVGPRFGAVRSSVALRRVRVALGAQGARKRGAGRAGRTCRTCSAGVSEDEVSDRDRKHEHKHVHAEYSKLLVRGRRGLRSPLLFGCVVLPHHAEKRIGLRSWSGVRNR